MAELAHDLGGALGLGRAGDPDRDRAGAHVRSRVEGHVLDVDLRASEREGDLGDRPGPVLDADPKLADVAPCEVGLEQPAPVLAGGAVPGADRCRVAGADHLGRCPQPLDHGGDLVGDRLAVGGEDVPPDRRIRARDPGRVAKAGADLGQPLGLLREGRRGLADEHVGEHVREVADGRHHPVVSLGIDRLRPGPEAGDRALQPVVVQPAGGVGRGQVPAGALEQLRAGVLDSRRLRAGERVPADEPRRAFPRRKACDQLALRRADVGDHGLGPAHRERLGDQSRQRSDRRRTEDDVGLGDRVGDRAGGGVEHPELEPAPQIPRVGVEAGDDGVEPALRGEPDRAADQPDA